LLGNRPGARAAGAAYLAAATTLGLCTLLPAVLGRGEGLTDLATRYRLQNLLPGVFRGPVAFPLFIVVAAPVLHLVNALGEEVFWRGYLLDWLEARWPGRRAWAADGLLWGLWHAPMIALLGWDFPGRPVSGVVAIAASQTFWSLVMCRETRRHNSLWPAAVMHATANALTFGLFDTSADHHWNLMFSPWGLAGGAVMAALALPVLTGRGITPGAGAFAHDPR
jgi:membrane protease YdiL (CAAX protease family)